MMIREKLRWAQKLVFSGRLRCLPEQVIFFITDKCNLACSHCFYWGHLNKEPNEATLEEIERFSRTLGRFSFLTLTGGEPFLRNDIPDIIKIFKKNNLVSGVSIPTNGFFTEHILKTTRDILRDVKGVDLSVKISLDGPQDVHDAIRGERGVFEKAVSTCRELAGLKKDYPSFKVGVIMTYSALNQEALSQALSYIQEKLNPDLISLNFVRGDTRDPAIKEADIKNYSKLYERILSFMSNKQRMRPSLYYKFYRAYKSKISEMVAHIRNKNRCLSPCYAGRLLCIIDSSLNVYPCETLGRSFGNLRDNDYDFQKLWFSREADLLRKEIYDTKCYCTYECGLQISTFFNVRAMLSLIPRMR